MSKATTRRPKTRRGPKSSVARAAAKKRVIDKPGSISKAVRKVVANPKRAVVQKRDHASDRKQDEKWHVAAANKIFPRNLTAKACYLVPGNPVVTRPEDAVANCFPGLELDVRNFDRRFFPGLVFNFVDSGGNPVDGVRYGALLAYTDLLEDPDLQIGEAETESLYADVNIKRAVAQKLYDDLSDGGDAATKLSHGKWYLDWIEQEHPRTRRKTTRLSMNKIDGLQAWRVVRGLEPGPVTIGLIRHDDENGQRLGGKKKKVVSKKDKVELKGWRRRYTDPTSGVISGAYQPGELMQGLCSPWQHDFRDCACHYWASNHPDLVLPEVYPGELLPGGEAVDPVLNDRVDWLRADRSREMAAAASDTIPKNRPYQVDHYQINSNWQNLSIVLENREVSAVYVPEVTDTANPYGSLKELVDVLRNWLAPLEMALALEYLYTYFSVQNPDQISDPVLKGTVDFVRQHLLLVAVSEMQHLRWVNELLWGLTTDGTFVPVLEPSELIPTGPAELRPADEQLSIEAVHTFMRPAHKIAFGPERYDLPTWANLAEFKKLHRNPGFRYRALRPLDPDVQKEFIIVEHERGFIDSTYARVVATLRQAQYPDHLISAAAADTERWHAT